MLTLFNRRYLSAISGAVCKDSGNSASSSCVMGSPCRDTMQRFIAGLQGHSARMAHFIPTSEIGAADRPAAASHQ